MDVRRNLAFPLEVAGVPRAEIATRVNEAAERLGIADLLDRKPAALSGGQRQRVALGRALVRRPRVCLLDEPLSNLDVSLRAQMRAEIKRLHRELGATFLYVTHDQTEAMTLSDRIAVLHLGKLQQVGSPRAIYDRPENTFVASFVGSPSINLIEAERLPPAVRERVDGAHLVGVRPEDVTVGHGIPPEGGIAGRVDVVEPTGPETWITVDALGARITGRASHGTNFSPGDDAWLTLPRECMHLFGKGNQRLST
jgi:multiple sugar transport system ATP-binding protein